MNDLQSGDPAFLEMCHRWLLFHYHCNDCGLSEDACEYGKICAYGKSTFTHVQACSRSECAYPRCDLIKSIVRHHKACKNEMCQVCAPVCKYQARSKVPPPPPPPPPTHSPYTASTLSPPLSAASPMQHSVQPQPSPCPPSQPSPQPPKRSSSQAELDVVRPGEGPLQSATEQQAAQQPQPHVRMLFEARHREHKRHLSSSLSRSSWTLDTASASGTSSGGCTVSMASAASGSIEAVAELQALQLGRSSHHPPPQHLQLGHEQQQLHQQQAVQPQQQTHGTATSCLAPSTCSPFARQSAPASLQHHPNSSHGIGSSITGTSSMPPTGEGVVMKGLQLTAGALQQAERHHHHQQQQQARQPLPQALSMPQQQQQQVSQQDQQQQQLGVPYSGPALTVLLQPPTSHQQQQCVAAVMPALHPVDLQQQQQQQMALSVAHHQAMYVPMQYTCTTAAFHGGSQVQHQQQAVGGVLAGTPGNLSLPTAGAVGLHASAPSYVSLPFGTMVKTPMQMGSPTLGMSYSLLHHQYGAPGQGAGMLLTPPPQQQVPAQQQQHLPGLVLGSAGAVPSGAGFFVGPQPVAGLAPVTLSYGPAAVLDTGSGVGPCPATAWGTYQTPGGPPRVSAAPQPPQHQQQLQQQQQHLHGHFPAVASGGTVTPMILAPQLAGAP